MLLKIINKRLYFIKGIFFSQFIPHGILCWSNLESHAGLTRRSIASEKCFSVKIGLNKISIISDMSRNN